MATLEEMVDKAIQVAVLRAHPVGSYFITESADNPHEILGGGVWQKLEGRFLLGANASYSVGSEGGEDMHTLTESEMPSHTHDSTIKSFTYQGNKIQFFNAANADKGGAWYGDYEFMIAAARKLNGTTGVDHILAEANLSTGKAIDTANTGGGASHNNMPPYRAVNIWKRTA